MDRIGVAIGFTPEAVGRTLSLATVIGIGGALSAAALSARFGRLLPIALGSVISVSAMSYLIGDFSERHYLFAVCVFSFTFNFILPYLMACVAAVDVSGRLIMVSNISSGGGLAVGPALAAVLQQEMGFDAVIWAGVALTLLSLIFIARLAIYRV